MKQNLLSEGRLLNGYGNLEEAGYAKSLVKEYNRNDIKAGKLRIKEWDYYYIGNNSYGVALTIADNSYMGLGSISILDFETKTFTTKSVMTLFPKGKTNLPSTSRIGDLVFQTKKLKITFENDGISRKLRAHFDKFRNGIDLDCDLELYDAPQDSMVICTPFKRKKHFYYNQKINCLRAKGKVVIGGKLYKFNPENSYAVLDWGRGVWTYSNTWYWSSLSGEVNGKKIGFNLGYGFGDTSSATENMIFYDGKGYKIDEVTFEIPKNEKGKDDFMSPWKFTSNDGSVDLVFTPIINRKDCTNALIIKSLQNQVFGRFTGTLRFDDNNDKKEIRINEMMGFAEKVKNVW